MAAICAFETFERRLKSTSTGHCKLRSWMPQFGGLLRVSGRLGTVKFRFATSSLHPDGEEQLSPFAQATPIPLPSLATWTRRLRRRGLRSRRSPASCSARPWTSASAWASASSHPRAAPQGCARLTAIGSRRKLRINEDGCRGRTCPKGNAVLGVRGRLRAELRQP